MLQLLSSPKKQEETLLILVQVTQQDLSNGLGFHSRYNPIALAINRSLILEGYPELKCSTRYEAIDLYAYVELPDDPREVLLWNPDNRVGYAIHPGKIKDPCEFLLEFHLRTDKIVY